VLRNVIQVKNASSPTSDTPSISAFEFTLGAVPPRQKTTHPLRLIRAIPTVIDPIAPERQHDTPPIPAHKVPAHVTRGASSTQLVIAPYTPENK